MDDPAVGTHQFRLLQVDLDGSSRLIDPINVEIQMAEPLKLTAPTPNPASNRTTLSFAVKEETEATVTLHDLLGRHVQILYDGSPTPGQSQRINLNASRLPSGPCILHLRAAGGMETQRMTVVR